MNNNHYGFPETYLDDYDYKQRDTYQQGRFSREAEIQDIIEEHHCHQQEEEEDSTDG